MALSQDLKDSINTELARRRMSQRELARRCGWSQTYLSRRLRITRSADKELTPSELEVIAEALGVPVSRFYPPVTAIVILGLAARGAA